MAVDRRLLKLHGALRRCSLRPPNRIVTMVARVTPALGVGIATSQPWTVAPGYRADGCCRPGLGRARLKSSRGTQVRRPICVDMGIGATLRRNFSRSCGFREFTSVEIEISHSPCTACADTLVGLLRSMKEKGTTVSQAPNRRVGERIYVGSAKRTPPAIPAALRWGELFDMPPQATTPQSLRELHAVGWQMAAPRVAIPNGAGTPAIALM